jgi:hypothetical protein
MSTVANFAMVPKANPNIPLPAGGEDFVSDPFPLPGLAEGSAVLLLRYRATEGRPTLKIRVNNNERVSLNLVANGEINSYSFHETILPGQLTELNNQVRASATGTGKVFISDIMVLYQMEV